MSRLRLIIAACAAAFVLVTIFAASRAEAIPAFARKYQMSCSTCHAPFPRLKPYGEEYAARGFRLEDPSKEPSRATYDVGDPLLKLSRDLPLAVRMEGHVAWKENGSSSQSDFESPWVFKILSGGPLSNTASYYLYFIFEEGEVIGLEDAYFQLNNVFKLPIDLLTGQFQVSDPLFKRELRLARFDYAIYKTRVGAVKMDLTYDRGLALAWHAPAAIEALLQVVNGNGLALANDFGNFDRDQYKNFSLRLARSFGEIRLGAFGYWGKEEGENGRTNRLYYWGPDLALGLGEHWQFSAEYLERRDNDPFYANNAGDDLVTRGGFAELHFFPRGADGRWILTGLYNNVDSDDVNARAKTVSLTGNYLLSRNVRLLMEAGRDIEQDKNRVSMGLITAF